MAVLTAAQKTQILGAICRALSEDRTPIAWTKTELLSELDTLDTFQDTTGDTAVNNQFSVGFKAKTSVADRALIFILLLIRRHLVGNPAHVALLRRMLNNLEVS